MKRATVWAGPVAAGFGLLFFGTLAPARAQQPSKAQISAIRSACQADYKSYCAGVPTGGQAALACLQQNASSLSPNCQQAVAAAGGTGSAAPPASQGSASAPGMSHPNSSPREEMALLRQACGADYRLYCRGVRPGGGRAIACLEDNGPSLSPRCQNALASARQSR
jgi:hypothetical protein